MKSFNLPALILVSCVIFCSSYGKETNTGNQKLKGDSAVIMESVKTSTVKYLSGNDSVSAYLAVPEGKGPFPAVILIHEWWGLNDWIKKDAKEFADSGYIAIAIDLYRGKSTGSPDEARKLSAGVDEVRSSKDLKAAFNYLSNLPEVNKNKIGSIGWCMGGGYSLRTALLIPSLSACVICYGRLVSDEEALKKIGCPVLGIFGENDKNIIPENVQQFEKALNKAGVENNILIYPGAGHAFMNPKNKELYNETVTEKAWNEIYTYLDNNLKRNK
jgi:carboxymethylenebutenolidase